MSDTAVRQIIDPVDPKELKNILHQPASLLLEEGVLKPYRFLKHYYLIATDGTEYFNSASVHCNKCCERHHRDKTTTYHHDCKRTGKCILLAGFLGNNFAFSFTYYGESHQKANHQKVGKRGIIVRLLILNWLKIAVSLWRRILF